MNLVSNGLELKSQIIRASTVTCEPIYGFLPCTTQLWGQLFLIVVYEYLLSLGESYISDGSDLFFKLTGPGYFGASLFHILPTIPQISLVLVSGLSASTTTAQEQATMAMNLLAGSAVMLLTLVWGICVALGRYDFSDSSTVENGILKTLTGFGVRTDDQTSYTAIFMIISMVPFLILQLAKIIKSSAGIRVTILISLIVTVALLLVYFFIQVLTPTLQNRRFEYLTQKFVTDKLLKLLSHYGEPNIPLIKGLFHKIDKNNERVVSTSELRVLLLGIQLQEDGDISNDYCSKVMEALDISGDVRIDEEEFLRVLSKWLTETNQSVTNHRHTTLKSHSRIQDQSPTIKILGTKSQISLRKMCQASMPIASLFVTLYGTYVASTTIVFFEIFKVHIQNTEEEQQNLVAARNTSTNADRSWPNYAKAALQLLVGSALLAALAQPLITTVGNFSTAANFPSFLVPYVVIPAAMNFRRAMSAISSARQKTEKSVSLTLSEIYGAVFMNNMVGLTVFLAIVYVRDLSWDVSAEVLVVLIICTLMGLFTSLCRQFPFWTSFLACLLYPASLALLYVLTTVLGWS